MNLVKKDFEKYLDFFDFQNTIFLKFFILTKIRWGTLWILYFSIKLVLKEVISKTKVVLKNIVKNCRGENISYHANMIHSSQFIAVKKCY